MTREKAGVAALYALSALFVASVPVARLVLGDESPIGPLFARAHGVALVVLLLVRSTMRSGRGRAGLLLLLALLVPLVTEQFGVRHLVVTGDHGNADRLGLELLLGMRLDFTLAWYVVVASSLGLAELLVPIRGPSPLAGLLPRAILASLACASWDLLLDPLCVSLGAWEWEAGGGYFGIPVANYAGWLATSLAIFSAYYLGTIVIGGRERERELGRFFEYLPLGVYGFFMLCLGLLCIRGGLAGPAFSGWVVATTYALLVAAVRADRR